jgi:hypothetical protein
MGWKLMGKKRCWWPNVDLWNLTKRVELDRLATKKQKVKKTKTLKKAEVIISKKLVQWKKLMIQMFVVKFKQKIIDLMKTILSK